jgi:hypothetical protein
MPSYSGIGEGGFGLSNLKSPTSTRGADGRPQESVEVAAVEAECEGGFTGRLEHPKSGNIARAAIWRDFMPAYDRIPDNIV